MIAFDLDNPQHLTAAVQHRMLHKVLQLATSAQQQMLQESDIPDSVLTCSPCDDLVLPDDAQQSVDAALTLLQPSLTASQKQALEAWADSLDEQREALESDLSDFQDALYDELVPEILAYIYD